MRIHGEHGQLGSFLAREDPDEVAASEILSDQEGRRKQDPTARDRDAPKRVATVGDEVAAHAHGDRLAIFRVQSSLVSVGAVRVPQAVVLGDLAGALLALGLAGHRYWTVGRFLESTDDASVKADFTTVAPKVSGYVAAVAVQDSQAVEVGDLLVRIDARDFARNLGEMIALRAFQGFTGGVLIPLAFTIIISLLPKARQPIGLALFAISATFAPAIGPTIGGYLIESLGWQYVFYVNLAPGALMIALLWLSLEPAPRRLSLLAKGDWAGVATLAIGLAALQAVLEEGNRLDWLGSPFVVRPSIVATVSLGLFLWVELRSDHPVIELRLLARCNFGFGVLANFLLGIALYGSVFVLPVYLARIQGDNAEQIGQALVFTPLSAIATASMEAEHAGSASAIYNMMRNLGGAFGIAGLQTFVTRREQFHSKVSMAHVSAFAEATRERIDALGQVIVARGGAISDGHPEAIVAIGRAVRRQACIMAFGDAFLVLGVALLAALAASRLLRRETGLAADAAH